MVNHFLIICIEFFHVRHPFFQNKDLRLYGNYPKISYTKISDKLKYAKSEDPDQTASEGAT